MAVETNEKVRFDDTAMLEWMMFHGANVGHSSDGEVCWVKWADRDGSYISNKRFDDPREAIQAAMRGEYHERF